MIRSMLLGLDGSAYSASAVELGCRWANQFDALLTGLGVIDEPAIVHGEAVPLGAGAFKEHRDEVLLGRARRQVEQFLEQFALRCAEAKVACKVLESVGDPYEQVVQEAQRFDLILLGQQTYFRFATQENPCKTLHKVLKSSPRPVVTVPERLLPPSAGSVLIAYDGSLPAARALQAFEASGLARLGDVHLITVGPVHDAAARHAARAAEFLRLHDVTARLHVVASDQAPGEVIVEQARIQQAGLLVMGAYGQPALREFFLGSVTRSLVESSKVPLFLFH